MSTQMTDDEIRKIAVLRVRAKQGFFAHLIVYVIVNALLVSIWAIFTRGILFWPAFRNGRVGHRIAHAWTEGLRVPWRLGTRMRLRRKSAGLSKTVGSPRQVYYRLPPLFLCIIPGYADW